ncbi:MAG TPA: PQQ-binding-like beta-propeller repeat protein, partial [Planctomycetaceae bacterium]|nr:PQQ-binding-like beta-propeller repeat protein [Planctomycetaceae bacterium]
TSNGARYSLETRPMRRIGPVLVLCSLIGWSGSTPADSWPQFHGPNASGLADSSHKLPADIGPDKNVVWKIALSPGHSSPVVFGDRVYVTAERDQQLLTIALDRASGRTLWERAAPHEKLESIHGIGSHAQCSPATDGERVVALFGSCGLICYDRDGHELWKVPMGPFKNEFGAGSSPQIVDDRVILCQDHDTDSFLAGYDKRTGQRLWKTDRSEFPRNYCTPVIWTVDGRRQIVVAATLRVVGYDFETGTELWTVRGISRAVCMSPVIGDDNTLYVAGWAAGGDESERIGVPPFSVVVKDIDKNANGTFEEDELPKGPIQQRFPQVDRDKNGSITEAEYEYFRKLFEQGQNVVIAIKPGAHGEATESHLLWKQRKLVPFCASPLFVDGLLFTIKDGGILACLDAATGQHLKQGRAFGTEDYYSSPVTGDGKLYLLDEEGHLSVVSATKDWRILHTAEFTEKTFATPAIVDNKIFLRTNGHLYCFGQ